jgi:hypothetical protein
VGSYFLRKSTNIVQGKEMKLDIFAYADGENTRPQPFPVRFTPRTEKIQKIIGRDAQEAREVLKIFDGKTKLTFANVM